MNTTIKKQNRILLTALIVLLASAGILIGVTGGANRKAKDDLPPAETGTLTEKSETAAPEEHRKQNVIRETETKKEESAKSAEKKDSDADAGTDSAELHDADEAAAAMQKPEDTLPQFSVPVDNLVIKGYSADLPVFSYTMNDYRVHSGIDIACSEGTPVLAAADGQVCEVFYDPMMGVTVGIRHAGGAVTRCRGLSEDTMNLVKTGEEVRRGQVIGSSGETALIESAEEAHVHFELTINGEHADPGEYMKLTYLEDVYEG
ncbi:MAG: M23 family metallopeptidase [Clostridia bacterium]|nr:M23 family metallopeptidase [Clostridia bacterium]